LIALDTSSLRRYLRRLVDGNTVLVTRAINSGEAMLPPVSLTEALSDVNITDEDRQRTLNIPLLPLFDGYWYRAGNLRRNLLANRMKAPVADCLIAQACLDMGVPLIAYDREFKRFIPMGLKLILEV